MKLPPTIMRHLHYSPIQVISPPSLSHYGWSRLALLRGRREPREDGSSTLQTRAVQHYLTQVKTATRPRQQHVLLQCTGLMSIPALRWHFLDTVAPYFPLPHNRIFSKSDAFNYPQRFISHWSQVAPTARYIYQVTGCWRGSRRMSLTVAQRRVMRSSLPYIHDCICAPTSPTVR
ncbi:hypothetical protein BDP27DRAFT_339618 [Rhodocollybia butyracea]|uniref:Uncharacterized protein n=1 Tax=Rhodocollybia butyracea TaxID=206335 RepID=A0A9P5UF86_9AGAR|nr:hypothetical protein BDP27DRAFT_339618 [Rhodocollybia butyracea]